MFNPCRNTGIEFRKRLGGTAALIALLTMLGMLAPTLAFARTIEVGPGKEFASIQAAINAAVDGDHIIVSPGVYRVNLEFRGKNIHLKSTNPRDRSIVAQTILDGGGAGSVVKFAGTETPDALLSGFTLKYGKANRGGGIAGNGTRATLTYNIITDNAADEVGGGIADCHGLIDHNIVTGNKAAAGGGLAYCNDITENDLQDGIIQYNDITGNTATSDGGGLYRCGAAIYGNEIHQNKAGGDGGGIARCSGMIVGNDISGNEAEGHGGGIAWYRDGQAIFNSISDVVFGYNVTVDIQYNTFSGNTAGGEGGGMYKCNIRIQKNDFYGNKAGTRGGALSACDVHIKDNEFFYNQAGVGGAIANTRAVIQNNVIQLNTADTGGALHDCDGLIDRNDVSNNKAKDGGAFAFCDGTIQFNTIKGNRAIATGEGEARGGAFYRCGAQIHRNDIVNNQATYSAALHVSGYGGALAECDGTIQNNLIAQNEARGYSKLEKTTAEARGGALYACNGTVQNNIIVQNVARFLLDPKAAGGTIKEPETEGGKAIGGAVSDCRGTFQNNTVDENYAIGVVGGAGLVNGGGIYGQRGPIRNSIVWENHIYGAYWISAEYPTRLSYGYSQLPESVPPAYSCIQGGAGSGTNNISMDPAFRDVTRQLRDLRFYDGGSTTTIVSPAPNAALVVYFSPFEDMNIEARDYRLSAVSPCIDAGMRIPELLYDFEGDPRGFDGPVAGTGDGSNYDIGADEYYIAPPPTPSPTPSPSPTPGDSPTPSPSPTPSLTPSPSPSPSPSPTPRTLEVRAADGEKITDAIEAANDGDTIIVYPGVYQENKPINFNGKNLVIRSQRPQNKDIVAATILDGANAGPVVVFSGQEKDRAALEGFTILKGRGDRGGGIQGNGTKAAIRYNKIVDNIATLEGGGIYDCDGVIEYNNISGNQVTGEAGVGAGLSGCDDVIRNNDISGNKALGADSKGGGLHACNGTIENNAITGNGAAFGGALAVCIGTITGNSLSGNTAAVAGGGLYQCDGVVSANTISGNVAEEDGGAAHTCSGTLQKNQFVSNTAKGNGGALAACNGWILENEFTNNQAEGNGGAIAKCRPTSMKSNKFIGNQARNGGAIFDVNGLIELNEVLDNVASANGGGLYQCHGKIQNNTIRGNRAGDSGGALADCDGTIQLNKDISANEAANAGGAFFGCDGTIQRNSVFANKALRGGALAGCNGVVRNNLIHENIATGSGGAAADSAASILNNTFHANEAQAEEGAVSGLINCRGEIVNNVIWGGKPANAPALGGSATPMYCVITGGAAAGTGNKNEEPRFFDESKKDFRLQPSSPCIDAGRKIADITDDFEGNKRPHIATTQPGGDRSGYDIGAYEFQGTAMPATPSPTPSPTLTPGPEPGAAAHFQFTAGAEGWTTGTVSSFTPPEIFWSDGQVNLISRSNSRTYGFWESPLTTLGVTASAERLFLAKYVVSTDIEEPTKVPQIRLRTSAANFAQTNVLGAESQGNAAFSPTPAGRQYMQYFTMPDGQSLVRMDLDLINFNPNDAAQARIALKELVLSSLDASTLRDRRVEVAVNFTSGANDWTASEAVFGLNKPRQQRVTPEGLLIRGVLPEATLIESPIYGYWDSTPSAASNPTLVAGRIYRAVFTLTSSAMNALVVPTFRLRLNDSGFRAYAYVNIESREVASIPVAGTPRQYAVYFYAPPELDGATLLSAFDYLYIEGGDNDPSVAVTLQAFQIESYLPPVAE